MRILLASKRAPDRKGRRNGGVQTYIATIAAELRRLGHEVEIGDALVRPHGWFDLGIISNHAHVTTLAYQCLRRVYVCHGIVPDEEPPAIGGVVFTSEEVRDRWKGSGPVVRQPVDLEFWCPDGRQREGMLRYSPRGGLDFLPAVAERLGMSFKHIRAATPDQARDSMRSAAVVLASGRAALEAAACGAPVVICDDRHYQGPLMETYFPDAMAKNYSGRGGVVPDPEAVAQAVRAVAPTRGWRGYAERHHDVRKIAPQLLEVACQTMRGC